MKCMLLAVITTQASLSADETIPLAELGGFVLNGNIFAGSGLVFVTNTEIHVRSQDFF